MLINKGIAVSTPSILLVPYSKSHVPTYHEWMKDPDIQTLTASEPLSLDEEYAMQKSWREDADKLTFIVCLPMAGENSCAEIEGNGEKGEKGEESKEVLVRAGEEVMVGDVNLFLSPPEDDDHDDEPENREGEKGRGETCKGELELMIALPKHRRKGYGKAAVLAFMQFVEKNLEGILGEFLGEEGKKTDDEKRQDKRKRRGLQLGVKIGGENRSSIGLFEGLGFVRISEGVNYFGEVEMRFGRVLLIGGEEKKGSGVVEGYKEVRYEEGSEGARGV